MTGRIYSFGVQRCTEHEQLFDVLTAYGVNVVIDLRNDAEVRKQGRLFGRTELTELLSLNGIHYRNYRDNFSMETRERKFLTSARYVDYDKYETSADFKSGITKMVNSVNQGFVVCLLGWAREPTDCHRFFVGEALYRNGIDVLHIGSGTEDPHSFLRQQFVDAECPVLDHVPMFEVKTQTFEERLAEARQKLNKRLGERYLKEASTNEKPAYRHLVGSGNYPFAFCL